MAEIEFSIVSDRGECQLSDAFYRIKIYCSQPKLSDFDIFKIWVITNYSMHANFKRDFPKMDIFGISKLDNFG